ncbi:MAG: arsenate reductase ArsC [Nitrospirota bacterium]
MKRGGNQQTVKEKVLFICTHNSARSQMAEGLLRALYEGRYEAYSAGTIATEVNPHAIEVMAEIGFDISTHRSKSIEEFQGIQFDHVVTVCDYARETCPFFPGAKHYIHKDFTDPASTGGSREEKLSVFRRVRDEIRQWIEETFGNQNAH